MSNVIKGNFKKQDRKPLHETHGPFRGQDANNFGDRLTRIRASLEKINRLMAELKDLKSEDKCQTKN